MRASVSWIGDVAFEGRTETGHKVVMDGPPEYGGSNRGPRPMETVLLGTGGCTTFDVVHILRKSRQDVTGCRVEIQAERAAKDPKVFTKIHFHFIVSGRALRPDRVERAIKLSAEKYCSASLMLGKTAEITHDFEIVNAWPREPS